MKESVERKKHELDVSQRDGDFERASKLRYLEIPELEKKAKQLEEEGEKNAPGTGDLKSLVVVRDRVTSDDIAKVVARATGIPVQSLLKGEKEKLVHVSMHNCSYPLLTR